MIKRKQFIPIFLIMIMLGFSLYCSNPNSEEEYKNLLELYQENCLTQPKQSEAYLLEAVQIKDLSNNSKAEAYMKLSENYSVFKKYDKSHEAIDKAELYYTADENFKKIAYARDSRAQINIKQGKFELADKQLIENLEYRNKKNLPLTNTVEIRGYYFYKLDKPAEAVTYYLSILPDVREENDYVHLSFLLQRLGDTYKNLSELNSAYQYYKEAYSIYLEHEDMFQIGRALHNMGTIKKQMGDFDTALEHYYKSLTYSERYDKPSRISNTLRSIGNIQKKIGDTDSALKYMNRALDYALQTNSPSIIGAAYTGIGIIYNSLEQYDLALDYYQKATPYIEQSGSKGQIASLYHNLAFYHKNNKNFAESEELYLKGLAICRDIGYRRGQVLILVNLGGLYMETEEKDKAEKYLQEALILSKKNGSKEKTKDIYEGLHNYYSRIGDYEKAYLYSQLYVTIKDSIFSDQKTVSMATLQEKYETEKKVNEINKLEQVNGEQELNLAKSRLSFWRLLFVLVIIAIILPFLVRRYFDKFRQAKNLEKLVTTQEKSLQETITDLRNTTLKKNQAEMKQVVFQENFDFLYKTAIEFLRLSSEDDIYQYLSENIHKMAGDSIVIVSSYHKDSNILTNRAVYGLESIEERFVKTLGQPLSGLKYEVPQYAKEILTRGKLTLLKGGFHEFMSYTVPHHIADAVVRLASINEIYTIGFYFNDELWGNASLMLTNGNTLKNVSGLEAFINQAAMAIQKRHVQIELQDSEEKYRQLVEQINDAIIVVQNDEIKFFNKRFIKLLGIENKELSSLELSNLLAKDSRLGLQEVLDIIMASEEEYMQIETNLKHTTGREITVDIRSSFIIYDRYPARLLVIRDITDIKIAQKRILYSERLSGLGELAAGVAHEIKNPLGNISSSAQIINSDYKISEDAKLYLDIIQRNVENANKTVKKLTDFATPGEINMRPANLIEVIDSTCMLLKGKLRENHITLEKDFQQIPNLIIDPVHIQGVMVNIVINAIQAQKMGGLLRITVEKSDEEVSIIFKDDGCGISETDQERIFNPFFTTKEEGSGLGLSMAYKIMHHHHGKIDISSEIDQGTSVVLHFPLKF